MFPFLARRFGYNLFVLVGVLFIVHLLVIFTGDPARALLPITAGEAQVEALRRQLGLDQPLLVQFWEFLKRAVQGDFGVSARHRTDAMGLVLSRAPATLKLGAAGIGVALVVSVPLGILAAVRKGSWIDQVARSVALAGQAIPNFWLAIMLILVFGVTLRWLPISGSGSWRHLVLPAIVVGMSPVPAIVRMLRSGLIEVLDKDYIRTAHANGLRSWRILSRHALRNAVIPAVTVLAFEIGWILSGALIAEVVFAYPGMGRLAYEAITNRDIAVVQAFVFVSAVLIVVTNMLLDVVYSLLDPRVRVN